ncbi:MAG: translation initiation factor Sui1 [Candidatus Schekmanbacteria bacterium]|nr:translation initiation factor Sui1 [Candidatus Schekmanbacteria bacterium]
MDNARLVYSTESGSFCPECGSSAAKCTCKKKKAEKQQPSSDGIVRIRRELKGRGGKTVTSVFGVPLDDNKLQELANKLKQRYGTGGTVKDRVIIIQGDHRDTIVEEIKKQGYNVKLAGG